MKKLNRILTSTAILSFSSLLLTGCFDPAEPSDKDIFLAINKKIEIINERNINDLNGEFYKPISLKSAQKISCKFYPDLGKEFEYFICSVKISTTNGHESHSAKITTSLFFRDGNWIADDF